MDNLVNIECHLKYYEKLTHSGIINIVVPNSEIRIRAIELARVGKKKSGYAEFTDCLYHALAIENNAIFITNDQRHISKMKDFGHIVGLRDYSSEFK
jgi:predicted nucleic acid-binding protein